MTGAATRLSFTPSAVSQQMAVLERQVGAPLLVRHARGVRLTEVGLALVTGGSEIDERLGRLEQDISDMVRLHGGRLRLAAFSSAAARLVPVAIDRFHREYPEVWLSLDVRDPQLTVDAVRSGAVDLGMIFDYQDGPQVATDGLPARRLTPDRMLVALPDGHPSVGTAAADGVAIGALEGDAWIRDCSPDPACRELLDRLCNQSGFRPNVAFESADYLAIGRLVAAGVGVALVPGLAAEQMPAGVALRPIDPDVRRRITVLQSAGAGPAAEAMINILAQVADEVSDPQAASSSAS